MIYIIHFLQVKIGECVKENLGDEKEKKDQYYYNLINDFDELVSKMKKAKKEINSKI